VVLAAALALSAAAEAESLAVCPVVLAAECALSEAAEAESFVD